MKKNIPPILFLFTVHVIAMLFGATVTLAYYNSGYKWGGTAVNYYISNVFAASWRTAIQAADASWDAAGSKFRFNYAGTTARNPNVFAANYSLDNYSDIGFFNYGSTGKIQALTHGGTTVLNGNTISERDTTFNTYYNFTTVGAVGSYDVQNVMTHEFGHWLKLLDLTLGSSPSWCSFSWESTMCGTIWSTGETWKRSLEGDDKNGIKAIYGT